MPFNGNGTFVTIGDPAVPDEVIRADQFNNAIDDIATGLTDAMTRDGQSPPTANIPMGGMRLTGLANATAAQDAITLSQAQALFSTAVTDVQPGFNWLDNHSAFVNQRNVSSTSLGTTYGFVGPDRWAYWCATTSSIYGGTGYGPVADAAIAPRTITLTRTISSASTTRAYVGQILPELKARMLSSRTVTFSFYASKLANATGTGIRVHMFSGTAAVGNDSSSGLASLAAGTWAGLAESYQDFPFVGVSYTRYTATFNVPIGTTQLAFAVSYVGAGTAPASDGFVMSAPKLEIGSAATAYVPETFESALMVCERYYEKSFSRETIPAQNVGTATGETRFNQVVGASTAQGAFSISYRTRKRMGATPTITLYNPAAANAQIRNITGATDWSASTASSPSETGFFLSGTSPAGSAAGNGAAIHWSADYELY